MVYVLNVVVGFIGLITNATFSGTSSTHSLRVCLSLRVLSKAPARPPTQMCCRATTQQGMSARTKLWISLWTSGHSRLRPRAWQHATIDNTSPIKEAMASKAPRRLFPAGLLLIPLNLDMSTSSVGMSNWSAYSRVAVMSSVRIWVDDRMKCFLNHAVAMSTDACFVRW